jgi:hypothetical protein
MLLASLALGAVLVAAAATAFTVRAWLRADAELLAVRRRELRHRAWAAERARFLAMRTSIADRALSTTDAVQLGSSVTRVGHQAIAGIPFGILSAIPATREGSKRVKDLHDGIADAVYGGIAGVSEGLGELSRRRLTGASATPPDADESDPPGPSTPPAGRPG